METPKSIFQNNEEVVHAVSDYLQRTDSTFKTTFSVRPYNRFSPTFSEWWFIPCEGGWPAYHCSKLSFRKVHPHDEYSTCLFAGFYVEKGLGQVVSNLPDVKKNLIMQDKWYWFRFLRYMENGDFDDAIRRVQEYSQCPVHLGMEAYPFNKVPDPDKERPSSQDSLDFLVSTPGTKLEIFKPAKGVLSEFKECSDLRALYCNKKKGT
jgi:hypothetical protein